MVGSIIVGIIGIIFVTVGYLIWKKEKITLLHSYHYDKVAEKNKRKFCTLSGWGIIIVGIGICLTAVIIGITNSLWSFVAFLIGFAFGIALLIYAGIRYNS